jgi:homoserine kinase
VIVDVVGPVRVPDEPEQNTAVVGALAVLGRAGASGRLHVTIRKGIPLGSGLGGSASSAAAGALAANTLLGNPLDAGGVATAALQGEMVAAGTMHGDNVMPALMGGVVLIDPADPTKSRRLPTKGLRFVILQPFREVMTAGARAGLAQLVSVEETVRHSANLAAMIHALLRGDNTEVGKLVMRDKIVEPQRVQQLPFFEPVRQAAIEAGALGCCLSGSGPAMVAILDERTAAVPICNAMLSGARAAGEQATVFETTVERRGARVVAQERTVPRSMS